MREYRGTLRPLCRWCRRSGARCTTGVSAVVVRARALVGDGGGGRRLRSGDRDQLGTPTVADGQQGAREQRAAQDKGHAHVPGQRPAAARASPTGPPWPRGCRKKRPHGSGHDTARGHSPPRARVRRGVRRCVRFVRALCPRHRRQLQCGLAALIGRKALPGGGQLRRAGRLSSFFVREKMRTRNFWASGTDVSTRRCARAHDTPLRRDGVGVDGQHLACVEANALVYKQLQDLVCALEGNLCRYTGWGDVRL